MNDERFCVGHVGQQRKKLQPVDESPCLGRAAFYLTVKIEPAPLGK
jgi:hypothetical protein